MKELRDNLIYDLLMVFSRFYEIDITDDEIEDFTTRYSTAIDFILHTYVKHIKEIEDEHK